MNSNLGCTAQGGGLGTRLHPDHYCKYQLHPDHYCKNQLHPDHYCKNHNPKHVHAYPMVTYMYVSMQEMRTSPDSGRVIGTCTYMYVWVCVTSTHSSGGTSLVTTVIGPVFSMLYSTCIVMLFAVSCQCVPRAAVSLVFTFTVSKCQFMCTCAYVQHSYV